MKKLFLILVCLFSFTVKADETDDPRLLVVVLHAQVVTYPNGQKEITYWASAKPNYQALLGCIRFTFSFPPPYRRISNGGGGNGVKNSPAFAKKVQSNTHHYLSVYARDMCGGGEGGDSKLIVVP